MAVTFDNASTAVGSAVLSLQWNHTATGTNPFIAVALCNDDNFSFSTVAYNNVALTQNNFVVALNVSGGIWTGSSIPNGISTISARVVGAVASTFIAGACSYAGVAQAQPVGTGVAISAAGATLHELSISSTANNICFAVIGSGNLEPFTNPSGNQTQRFDVSLAGSTNMVGAEKLATGATTQFSWSTVASAATFRAAIQISLTVQTVATSGFSMPLLGVGR